MADWENWAYADWASSLNSLVATAILFIIITLCLRITGLRSLSKMSSTDFVLTVALGSVFASIIVTPKPSLAVGAVAIVSIFLVRWAVARLKTDTKIAARLIDNQPVYLMLEDEVLHDALKKTSVSISELHAKLREANVYNYDQVIRVVLETTGDVSVLHRATNSSDIQLPFSKMLGAPKAAASVDFG